jgi:hypothetical protein
VPIFVLHFLQAVALNMIIKIIKKTYFTVLGYESRNEGTLDLEK